MKNTLTTLSQDYDEYIHFVDDTNTMNYPTSVHCMFCGGNHEGSWCMAIDDMPTLAQDALSMENWDQC